MNTGRLETFSDGVLAIIITIMVLEVEAPEDLSLEALKPVLPVLLSFLLSFVYIGIFWINHHHLFQVVKKVNGKILWANLHLLFWLSLIPFATSWMGEHHLTGTPTLLYGIILLMCSLAYSLLLQIVMQEYDADFVLKKMLGNRRKEKQSIFIYVCGILSSFYLPWLSVSCYVLVALMWVAPNQNLEFENE